MGGPGYCATRASKRRFPREAGRLRERLSHGRGTVPRVSEQSLHSTVICSIEHFIERKPRTLISNCAKVVMQMKRISYYKLGLALSATLVIAAAFASKPTGASQQSDVQIPSTPMK